MSDSQGQKRPVSAKRAAAIDASAWKRACDEITASILSDQLKKSGRLCIDPEIVAGAMKDRVAQAKIDLGTHDPTAVDCFCRHHAIIMVGALQQSKMTGSNPGHLFDAARGLLERYIAGRS
jgi:hypothetical protein